MSEGLWLNLGSADTAWPKPWVNVDSRMMPGVDVVENIGILRRYKPESCQRIAAIHCLDHFSRWDYPRVLKRWHELLQPGGELLLSVIDFHNIVELYKHGVPLKDLIGSLVAAQDYDSNVRRMHWTFVSLTEDLEQAGFESIRRTWDLQLPDPNCSHSRIGHVPTSLNVIAYK